MAEEKDLQPYIAQVKDAALAHALSFGVGYIHETQPARERQVVEYLFDAGAIQVRTWPCFVAAVVFLHPARSYPLAGYWVFTVVFISSSGLLRCA